MLWMLCKPIECAGFPMPPTTRTIRALLDPVQISEEAGIASLATLAASIAALVLATQGSAGDCA